MALPNGKTADGTIGGVEYLEAEGSGAYSISDGSASGTRIFYIDYSDRVSFVKELSGYATTSPDGSRVIITPPQTFPSYSFLVCKGVSVEPWKISASSSTYDFATVTATYSPQEEGDQDQDDDEGDKTLGSHRISVEAEFLEIGKMALEWGTVGGRDVSQPIPAGKRVVVIRHTFTIDESPTSKSTEIAANAGKVMSASWPGNNNVLDRQFAAGTLLFVGGESERVIAADGQRPWRVTLQFLERVDKKADGSAATWNMFFDDVDGDWKKVFKQFDEEQFKPYPTDGAFGGLIS
jgi:hypothetical protein